MNRDHEKNVCYFFKQFKLKYMYIILVVCDLHLEFMITYGYNALYHGLEYICT